MKVFPFPIRPFKYIKRFLPRTLFARSLLIIVMPLILVQGMTTYVFIDRHWSWNTKNTAHLLAGQITTVVDMYATQNALYKKSLGRYALGVSVDHSLQLSLEQIIQDKQTYAWDEQYFDEVLEGFLGFPFRVRMQGDYMLVDVLVGEEVLHISTDRKRLFAKTTPIFLMWSLITPIFFLIIAAIFMRNQVRPIRRLANAVYLFGKRQMTKPFKPQGAYEVRKAGIAFNQMRERIQRQITQRTEMLAGVSHDLRTPLTRMELQLAMMGEGEEVQALHADIKEMTQTIDEYIDFARGEDKESARVMNVSTLLTEIVHKLRDPSVQVHLNLPKTLKLLARKHSLQRCFTNIIANGKKYAKNIWITGDYEEGEILITIDDDGPGIPEDKRQDVFKPFFRLESSRNRATGGSGLGLAIAYDIIVSHGGQISIEESPQGGVRVLISIPE